MTRPHLGWLVASGGLALLLVLLLFAYGGLDFAAIGRLLLGVPLPALAAIALLLGVNNALAGEKWRLIATQLQPDDAAAMPRLSYFAFTSIGVALGQVVPAQLSLVLSRSLGAHLHGGRALSRGAAATLFDYFFDVLVAALLALASILTLAAGGGGSLWAGCALALCLAGFVCYGTAARLGAAVTRRLAALASGRLRALGEVLADSPLLLPGIGRRLLAISVARFLLLVVMGAVSARAIGLDLPVWQIAAALPFAVVANALALTPGSLGVNEWTVSSALAAFGAPFAAAAAWALVTRVLVALAAALCGGIGLLIVAAARPWRRTQPGGATGTSAR